MRRCWVSGKKASIILSWVCSWRARLAAMRACSRAYCVSPVSSCTRVGRRPRRRTDPRSFGGSMAGESDAARDVDRTKRMHRTASESCRNAGSAGCGGEFQAPVTSERRGLALGNGPPGNRRAARSVSRDRSSGVPLDAPLRAIGTQKRIVECRNSSAVSRPFRHGSPASCPKFVCSVAGRGGRQSGAGGREEGGAGGRRSEGAGPGGGGRWRSGKTMPATNR